MAFTDGIVMNSAYPPEREFPSIRPSGQNCSWPAAHQRHVDLQVVRAQLQSCLQAREARARVVECNPEPERRELIERLPEDREVGDGLALGDLEHQVLG